MKNIPDFRFFILFLSLSLLYSCSGWNTSLGRKTQFQYASTHNPEATPSLKIQEPWWQEKQVFQIKADRDTVLYTSGGTTLYYTAGTLLNAQNEIVSDWVSLQVQEAYTKGQMIFYNAPTVSDGRLLESGGEISLRIFQGNEEVQLDPNGQGLQVKLATIVSSEMELFIGRRDRKQNLNWEKDSLLQADNFDGNENNDESYNDDQYQLDSIEKAILLANGDYSYLQGSADSYLFTTKELGWINCDRFYNDSTEKTNFVVHMKTPMPEGQMLNAYIVFEDLNSVMPAYSYDNGLTFIVSNIPVGSRVKLVMLGEMDKTFYIDVQQLEISKDQSVWSSLSPYTKEGMKKVLEEI